MRPTGCLTAAAILLAAAPARAAGEGEWQVAAQAGYATVAADGRNPSGWQAGADVQYGFSDAWAARLSFSTSRHGITKNDDAGLPGGRVLSQSAVAGVTYSIDVLRVVPTVELGVALLLVNGDVIQPRSGIGIEAGLGAEYFLDRHWTLGVSFRYLFAPADVATFPPALDRTPFFFSAGLRAGRIF